MRTELLQQLTDVLRREYRDCTLHCFGSFAAGLYLPNADMDLVLVSNRFKTTGRATFTKLGDYRRVARVLSNCGIADGRSVVIIHKARVPLVKFVDRRTGLKIDMSFDNETGIIANGTFQQWKSQFPAMPIIVTLVKQFLAMRGLNDVATMGLGGFSVTCLVTSLLQLMPQVQSGDVIPEQRLGDVLMEFFELYGKNFNTTQTGISLDPPGYFEKVRRVILSLGIVTLTTLMCSGLTPPIFHIVLRTQTDCPS